MSILSQLGPKPEGNPGAMVAASGKLADAARQISDAAKPAVTLLPSSAFSGPARGALDSGFREVQSLGRAAAGLLEQEARTLATEAGKLREAQSAWEDKKTRLIAEEKARVEREARERASR